MIPPRGAANGNQKRCAPDAGSAYTGLPVEMRNMSGRRRIGFVLLRRGLRKGNVLLQAAGAFLILLHWARRRRAAVFDLEAGQKAGLAVNRPGDGPIAFRIESA